MAEELTLEHSTGLFKTKEPHKPIISALTADFNFGFCAVN